ncbi:hypothetical protein [Streptomyces wuyuanensis]|uniref:hypothetical protein n=1 Tax=Streptomyces wuyuanensis TaxID=1196353 RepID=UPI003438B8E9
MDAELGEGDAGPVPAMAFAIDGELKTVQQVVRQRMKRASPNTGDFERGWSLGVVCQGLDR